MSSLIGNNIRLRAPEPEDLEILYSWENNDELWHHGQTLKPFSKDVLRKYLDTAHLDIFENKQVRFTIETLAVTALPIGFIDLFDFDPQHQRAGVGILIGEKDKHNKGFGKDALATLCKYAFTTLLLNQLYCSVLSINTNSLRLFTSAGFLKTGIRKEWIRTQSAWEDEVFFQLLRSEWLSRNV
ncbi:MAG: GNAT family N-acetyltransferase [Bacteroidetes bacterium]|jgi:diamine N-acetyltransferase|nr:GNAT family N-acetyltransferase [Bacteroidota bacterium]MBT4402171.1 GNAT family N-acetyltransferase [Bacteroidota bacterium]MBT4412357.1 GNAT family N-acetyltransferase [Bacteroidota bacterium]MBT7465405.1 GNAT family N-acetyltransferase [Bacteroidota bacterium]